MNDKYFDILKAAIKGAVHQDYKTVVEKADLYRKFVTGKNQVDLILSYAPRETKEQKKQRIEIYHERTKDTSAKIRAQFEKVSSVEYTLDIDNATDALQAQLSNFTGKTLQQWVEDKNLFYNFIDPNAWVLVYMREDGTSYPVIATAAEAVDFEYSFGWLKYLIVCKNIPSEEGGAKEYTLIAPQYQITARQQKKGVESLGEGAIKEKVKDFTYEFKEYATIATVTPARRFGYIADYDTDMRTYAGILDCASSLYKKLINSVSEADLSTALHVFPQKFQIGEPCDYQSSTSRCEGGIMSHTDEECPKCKGKGVITHTTVQDFILVRPTDADGEQKYIPLSERVHYSSPPFDIVKHQDAKVEQYPKDISMSIFGIDVTSRPNGNVTATEIENFYDSLNQVLLPFARNGSRLYKFIGETAAQYLGLSNVVISHQYPSDFKMMGLSDWLKILNEANTANASPVVKSLINSEVLRKLTNNNRIQDTKQAVLEAVRPFSSLSESIIATLIGTLPSDDVNRYLYLYADKLLTEVLDKNEALIEQPRTLINRIKELAKERAAANSIAPRDLI